VPRIGKFGYILLPFGKFYCDMGNLMAVWRLGQFCDDLVRRANKDLATLLEVTIAVRKYLLETVY
jgi:hypothetical protein